MERSLPRGRIGARLSILGVVVALQATACAPSPPTPQAIQKAMAACIASGAEIPRLTHVAMSGVEDAGDAGLAREAAEACESSEKRLERIGAPRSCLLATKHMSSISSTLAEVLDGEQPEDWKRKLPGYFAYADLKACALAAELPPPPRSLGR